MVDDLPERDVGDNDVTSMVIIFVVLLLKKIKLRCLQGGVHVRRNVLVSKKSHAMNNKTKLFQKLQHNYARTKSPLSNLYHQQSYPIKATTYNQLIVEISHRFILPGFLPRPFPQFFFDFTF